MNYEELGDSIGHVILFQEYLKEHFQSFASRISREREGEESKEAEGSIKEEDIKETANIADAENVLLYEMEYILSGHYKELENLSQVVMSMFLIRTISNFITIFSDSGIRNEAGIIAAGILGLKLQDLIGLTKEKIHLKADEVSSKKERLSAGYDDYISLLLFTKLKEIQSYRSLDLIQENVRLHHNKNFYIKNTLPYIQVGSECNMKGKFSSLSFVQSFLEDSKNFHNYTLTMETAY